MQNTTPQLIPTAQLYHKVMKMTTVKEDKFVGSKLVWIMQLVTKRKIKNCSWKLDRACLWCVISVKIGCTDHKVIFKERMLSLGVVNWRV